MVGGMQDVASSESTPLVPSTTQTLREAYLSRLGYTPLRFSDLQTVSPSPFIGGSKETAYLERRLAQSPADDDDSFDGGSSGGFFSRLLPAGSIRASVFNLCAATLGAGALSLPYAFSLSGLVLGLALLALAGLTSVFSIHLLLIAGEQTGLKSYEDLATFFLGRKMTWVVESMIIIFCFGTLVGYLIVIGDILEPLVMEITDSFVADRAVLMSAFALLVMLPLSANDKVAALRFSSLIGFASITYLVLAVVARYPVERDANRDWADSSSAIVLNFKAVSSISFFSFAFCCQVNVFSIYTELQRPTIKRMGKVSWISVSLSFMLYAIIGSLGYLSFGECTEGNILLMYDSTSNVPIAIGEVLLVVAISTAYPLCVFPCRFTIEMALWPQSKDPYHMRHYGITLLLVLLSLILAIFAPGVSVVFQILGAMPSAVICFCVPAAYALRLKNRRRIKGMIWLIHLLLWGGAIVGIFGTVLAVLELFESSSQPELCEA